MGYKRPMIVQSINRGLAMKLSLIKIFHLCTLALADATVDNGCLWAIHGSHKDFKPDGLVRRFLRDDNGVQFWRLKVWNLELAVTRKQ
ncbi:putative phytanoyl-CoA dioxygenase [Helianthus anomalus]